ncbi:MAG: hypothetical protein Terrestrivirus2_29 [Terrestrivirus sp.]|uniref:Uncharacterized protein n=1 Tax=Terrestrivirus sp. TaxID=2487775 RepID=A0A3G4ZNG9_9VIRU|nr:MAG: hypothetical protein Terrestrivirus2_29 [Terrestrivirus sp.]
MDQRVEKMITEHKSSIQHKPLTREQMDDKIKQLINERR